MLWIRWSVQWLSSHADWMKACFNRKIKSWSRYLSGRHFSIVTDRQAVNFVFNTERPGENSASARWWRNETVLVWDVLNVTGQFPAPTIELLKLDVTTWQHFCSVLIYRSIFWLREDIDSWTSGWKRKIFFFPIKTMTIVWAPGIPNLLQYKAHSTIDGGLVDTDTSVTVVAGIVIGIYVGVMASAIKLTIFHFLLSWRCR